MKLIDCFMYFDEDLVLDIRLNTLKDNVDRFVIVEATKNHAGEDKNLKFKIENFQKFKDKIKYIIVDDLPLKAKSPKKGKKTLISQNEGSTIITSTARGSFHDNHDVTPKHADCWNCSGTLERSRFGPHGHQRRARCG